MLFIEGPRNDTMNNQHLRHYLDGLIREVRSQMATADQVLLDVAGVVDRYSSAHAEIQAIGAAIAQVRQPLPMQSHQGQPLAEPVPTAAQIAEQVEREKWNEFMRTAPPRQVNGG